MRKKLLSLLLTCIMACAMFAMPVAAAETVPTNAEATYVEIMPTANSYFSGSTGTMNALNSGESAHWTVTASTPNGAKITSVSVPVTVSSGSASLYLYVKHPSGATAYQLVGSSSKTLTFSEFNGLDPIGKWEIWIRTTGTVSTASARITGNYTY